MGKQKNEKSPVTHFWCHLTPVVAEEHGPLAELATGWGSVEPWTKDAKLPPAEYKCEKTPVWTSDRTVAPKPSGPTVNGLDSRLLSVKCQCTAKFMESGADEGADTDAGADEDTDATAVQDADFAGAGPGADAPARAFTDADEGATAEQDDDFASAGPGPDASAFADAGADEAGDDNASTGADEAAIHKASTWVDDNFGK